MRYAPSKRLAALQHPESETEACRDRAAARPPLSIPMATVIPPLPYAGSTVDSLRADRHGWGFALLLLIVGTLFLRPADLFPAVSGWPIYQFLVLICLAVAARPALHQLSRGHARQQPVTICLLLLLVAVGLSHLSHGFVWGARTSMWMAGKLVIFYLLMTALLNSPARLLIFTRWLTLVISLMAALALLDHYEILSIDAIEAVHSRHSTEQAPSGQVDRIRGTGIFQDPNDLGLVIVTGIVFTGYFLMRPHVGWPRYVWLIPMGVLLAALAHTHSRGALLSLVAVVGAGLVYRRSWIMMGVGSATLLPIILFAFSSRMTDISSVHEGTGQSRLQIWSESLAVWRQFPLFGIGQGMLVEQVGVVSHNSFLQCFSELGLVGGISFVGAFLAAALGVWPRLEAVGSQEPAIVRLRAYVFAALVGYAAGISIISRQFVTPTYLMLGFAAAVHSLTLSPASELRINNRLILLTLSASAAALLFFYICVRLLVRW